MSDPPFVLEFVDDEGELDLIAFFAAEEAFADRRRTAEQQASGTAKKARPYQSRQTYVKKNPLTSAWYLDYCVDANNTWRNPLHRDGKLFRQRFFFSFDDVTAIVASIEMQENYFWKKKTDAFGRPAHPIRLLVLSSLRLLTRNCTLDCCYESTYISPSVIGAFFKKFIHWYAEVVCPEVVRHPAPNQEAVRSNGAEYAAAGFPWVICSVDCVHTRHWGVAHNLKVVSTGKEHYPSRVFEVSCNHRGMATSVTRGFYGTVVDKSIVKFDGFMCAIRAGLYKSFKYLLYNESGVLEECTGGACLNDNGYLYIPTMMEPTKDPVDEADQQWSEMAESLRKDIERLFGVLKQAFAILKYGTRFGDLGVVDDIFLTCLAMYNQRKEIDGLDEEWVLANDDGDLPQGESNIQRRLNEVMARGEALQRGPGEHVLQCNPVSPNEKREHDIVKRKFITHFKHALANGEVFWPRRTGGSRMYQPGAV